MLAVVAASSWADKALARRASANAALDGALVALAVTTALVARIARKTDGSLDRAHAQALEASRYARSLIEASLDPLVTISLAGRITDVNHATEKATGVFRAS